MKVFDLAKCAGALLVAIALGACGGGGGGDGGGGAGAPPASTVVGPAGGTVLGPNGAKIEIPPGALAGDVAISIEESSAGAPPLPGGSTAIGAMFAFLPHGTTFATPVTLTLPFDPAAVAGGKAPLLLKTNAQNQWEQVATATFGAASVSAQITSFSNGQIAVEPINRPFREWSFKVFPGNGTGPFTQPPTDGSGTQEGGILDRTFRFGSAFFDLPFVSGGRRHETDQKADGLILSSDNGTTFGVFTESPSNRLGGTEPIGSVAELKQSQSFKKTGANPTMRFTISSVILSAMDFTQARIHLGTADPNYYVSSEVYFEISAYTSTGGEFFRKAGRASVRGNGDSWTPQAVTDASSRSALWSDANFDFSVTPIFDGDPGEVLGCKGNGAELKLKEPLTHNIDLSPLKGDADEFTLVILTYAQAVNRRGGGSRFDCVISASNAFLRDPLEIGGTALVTSGLEPTNRPLPPPPPRTLLPPASCTPGSGPAGSLQFDAPTYLIGEYAGNAPVVTVTRTGGSSGEVSATVSTSDGTAVAGVDYLPVQATVFFGDGDAAPRVIPIPTIQNTVVAADKTVNLTLSQPGGCATLGTQTVALLTIHDDGGEGLPPPPSFTIGGTVSGLTGTGLVLQDLKFVPITPGNGPFTFPVPTQSGAPYAVTVVSQPNNPPQLCTVLNGSGTVGNANITNVEVRCAAPPATPGLDPTFGTGGKVTTPATGTGNAVALQADGKLITAGGAFTLTRHNPDGSLDTSFGTNGKVTSSFGAGSGTANDVAIQADGKIVVAGSERASGASNDDFALRRYNVDGSLDTSFGAGGIVRTDFAANADVAKALAIQPDGKIVVAGQAHNGAGTDFAVARYNVDGSADASFGAGGKVTTDVLGGTDFASVMLLQPDGQIVVLGRVSQAGSSVVGIGALVRYNDDGSLDTGFGIGGKVTGTGNEPSSGLALQADGKILVSGSVDPGSTNSAFAITRYLPNGTVDPSFTTVPTRFFTAGNGSIGRAVAVQADGKLVIVGEAASGASSTFDAAIARFEANGSLDASFGTGGKLLVDFFANTDTLADVLIQPDGKIVAAGSARNGSFTEFALTRVLP